MAATTADRIYKAALAARKQALVLSESYVSRLERVYSDAAAVIRRKIGAASNDDGKVDLTRLNSLMQSIQATLKELANERERLLNEGLGAVSSKGTRNVQDVYPARVALAGGIAFGTVAADAVNFAIHFIGNDGLQLSDRLWKLEGDLYQEVKDAVERAVVLGTSAERAAQELIRRGEPVSDELKAKMGLNAAAKMGDQGAALFTGEGNPLFNAKRLFRTEMNRAYSEAYRASCREIDAIGMKWNLSPSHKVTDICDVLATQDVYGLGPGVYPMNNLVPKPAHPLCMCFETAVFEGGEEE